MVSRPIPQCLTCAHWQSPLGRTDEDARGDKPIQVCKAFPLPAGIPDDIWWNRTDHRTPHAGDQGIVWEADDDVRNGGKMKFPDWAMNTTDTA